MSKRRKDLNDYRIAIYPDSYREFSQLGLNFEIKPSGGCYDGEEIQSKANFQLLDLNKLDTFTTNYLKTSKMR